MTRVLIAEDDDILRENIVFDLQLRGYDVLAAANGREALELAHAAGRVPDIIVSDVAMPDLDGFALLAIIRRDPALRSVPVLFVSGVNNPQAVRRGRQLGVDEYIVKPFSIDDLIIAIENKVRRAATYREEAIQEYDRLRQRLLSMLAHELRTPLVPIRGGTEMLAQRLERMSDDEVESLLGLIQSGVSRISRLADRTLALVQIESGNFTPLLEQDGALCDLCDVVYAARMAVEKERAFYNNNPMLVVSECAEPLPIRGVYRYLQLMLEEPLRNALAFAPPGSTVKVVLFRQNGEAKVSIQDQGPGINPEDLQRVWEHFEQIDRDRVEQQGAGIGLSLARAVARAHGGECTLESDLGVGTSVTFALPLRPVRPPAKQRQAA